MNQSTNTSTALELRGINKNYGDHQVLQDIDLSLASGESLAIIGHNGAGKTTLMKLLLNLTRPSTGSISQLHQSIGFLPETVSFHPGMSGRQMLRFYARLKHESTRQCDELLELLGLADAADRLIRTWSKGMRQRLGLAQALLGNPSLLLLDEPTTGLDPFLRQHFYEIIGERQAAGTTVLISSHALTEIEAQTDRIAIMKNGRIVIQGSLEELRARAGLPVQITVNCAPGKCEALQTELGASTNSRRGIDDKLEISCSNDEKIALLHSITGLQALVEDIQLNPPRLNELYAHFVNGADS